AENASRHSRQNVLPAAASLVGCLWHSPASARARLRAASTFAHLNPPPPFACTRARGPQMLQVARRARASISLRECNAILLQEARRPLAWASNHSATAHARVRSKGAQGAIAPGLVHHVEEP